MTMRFERLSAYNEAMVLSSIAIGLVVVACQKSGAPSVQAALDVLPKVKSAGKAVIYHDGDTELQGYVAGVGKNRPIVLVVHDWNGLDAYEEHRVKMLADLGYAAFAVDIYGKGVRPKTTQECSAEAGKYYQNANLLHHRLQAAVKFASANNIGDPKKICAIGYCFGGSSVLEMARTNMPLLGVVSFHGGLVGPSKAQPHCKVKVLALNGAADPMVTEANVAAMIKEFRGVGAEVVSMSYPDAGHAFTVPGSERFGIKGVAYQAAADKSSWSTMQAALKAWFSGKSFGQFTDKRPTGK